MSDLFTFLKKANEGGFECVDEMTDAEVKAISPFVLLGWGNGASSNNEIHTVMTDSIMNHRVFSLAKHPRLLLKLFIAANNGIDRTRYKYIKNAASKGTKEVMAIAEYYQCSVREAKDYALILTDDDRKRIVELVDHKQS